MIETLHPGLYYQETPGEPTRQGVSSSTGAFVGTAVKGKIGESVRVANWNEFVREFGSFNVNSYLAYAVKGFFENGGSVAYISRVVHYDTEGAKTSAKSSAQLEDETPTAYVDVIAKTDGTWGDNLSAEIANVNSGEFTFLVKENGTVVETYNKVTLATLEDIVESNYISVTVLDEGATPVETDVSLTGGSNGITGIEGTDYVGDPAKGTGIYAFEKDPVRLLAVPGITDSAVVSGLQTFVAERVGTFAIVDTPFGSTRDDYVQFKTDTNFNADRGGVYGPWVLVNDPIGVGKNPTKYVPLSGHLAGFVAKNDAERGEWKAPAGVSAKLLGVTGLEHNFSDADLDVLTPNHINVARAFPEEGIVVWGARVANAGTITKKYVPVTRNTDAVALEILANTRFATFEVNDATLWKKLKLTIEGLLRDRWTSGGLKGETEAEAFYVKADASTTSQEDIDQGRTNVEVGISNQKPNEFTVFRMNLRN